MQKGVKLRPSGVLPDRSPVFGGLTPATAVWAPPRCTQNFGGPTHLGPPVSNSPHFVRPRINKQMMWRVIDCNQLCNQFPIRRNPVRTGVSTLKKSSTEMGAGVRGLTTLLFFDLAGVSTSYHTFGLAWLRTFGLSLCRASRAPPRRRHAAVVAYHK